MLAVWELGADVPHRIQKAYTGASDCSEWDITHYSSVSELLAHEAVLVRVGPQKL
jgi:hypothetical protein